MKANSFLGFALTIIAIGLLLGCGGSSSPASPGTSNTDLSPAYAVSDSGNRQLWGLWQCRMEPGSGAIEVVPLRSATFTANVNNLLEGQPGNLQITDLDLTNFTSEGLLPCTVTLRHPMPGLDQFHGFDVWGVFLHNGATDIAYDGLTYSGGPAAGENEAVLLNPDGYTRWFNYPEFDGDGMPILEYWPGTLSNLPAPTATLNPFKIFANGLDVEEDYYEWITIPANAEDRSIFRAGEVNSRRYELDFPIIDDEPVVDFQYAVVASWEQGDPTLTGQPAAYDPFDFPSSASREEAFFVSVSTAESDLYYVDETSYGGAFVADIEVFDWQGGSVGGNGVPNEIESIIVEGDFLPGGSYQWTQSELATLAIPATENSSVFQVDIMDCVPQGVGDADLWVIVEAAGMWGESYYQGFDTEYPDGAHRAAFRRGRVDVSDESPLVPVIYNLVLTIERNSNNLITGIELDWDDNDGITGYNIYRQDPFDDTDDWALIPDSPVAASEYTDNDIVGNEAYQYRVVGLVGTTEMPDVSVEAYAILENAEDNVNTDCVWDTCAFPIMYNPNYLPWSLFNEFAPLNQTPQNGSYCWDESGHQNGPGTLGSYWTGSATIFATPVLPLPDGADTCEADFCVRLNNMWPWWPGNHCGTIVGVTDVVEDGPDNPFVPSQDYIEGLDYNVDHVQGFSMYGNYTNITSANDKGHGVQYPEYQVIEYAWSKFALPDVFTTENARAAFAWACGNAAGGTAIANAGTSLDDIAVLVY